MKFISHIPKGIALLFLFVLSTLAVNGQTWESNLVYYDPDYGNLVYAPDPATGNVIPDFSYAGYKNSEAPFPDLESVPVIELEPEPNQDNTSMIHYAIEDAKYFPLNSDGIRAIIHLKKGLYQINSTIILDGDGLVLRGEMHPDPNKQFDPLYSTILQAEWPDSNANLKYVIYAGGGDPNSRFGSNWNVTETPALTNIISPFVPVGSRTFTITTEGMNGNLSVGDNIVIVYPITEALLAAIQSIPGTTIWDDPGDVPPIAFNRNITGLTNVSSTSMDVTIDAPIFNNLDIANLSQAYIYELDKDRSAQGIFTNIFIENISIDIKPYPGTDPYMKLPKLYQTAIQMTQVEDVWVRDCNARGFYRAGFRTNTAVRVTIEDCRAIDPAGPALLGSYRYNFDMGSASQLVLVQDCFAHSGRHHFVSSGKSLTSGCVFLNCDSDEAKDSSEGHGRWTMGFLYDNHEEYDSPAPMGPGKKRKLALFYRAEGGPNPINGGAGWSIAHSVAWNCDVSGDNPAYPGELIVQQPPTAQNYAIGCLGDITRDGADNDIITPPGIMLGYVENGTGNLNPKSLFLAQLADRLNSSGGSGSGGSMIEGGNLVLSDEGKIETFKVFPNYPNPFNPSTAIAYELPIEADVKLTIYDMLGQKVRTLVNQQQAAGSHEAVWHGRSDDGSSAGSGLYIYHFQAGKYSKMAKMLLLK